MILQAGGLLYVGALSLALIGALRNWRLGPALRLATLGVALNTLVIAVNSGAMPVATPALQAAQGQAKVQEIAAGRVYENTHLAHGAVRLAAFSDILPLRVPAGPGNVYSVGDVLLLLGAAGLAYRGTRRPYADASGGGTQRHGGRQWVGETTRTPG